MRRRPFIVVQRTEISSYPIANIREAAVKFSNSSLSLGRIKLEVQLGIFRIEMKANIVFLDHLSRGWVYIQKIRGQ